ncbi:unnamed protein product [Penicillium salamii]|uniref:Zn(2)-C6 fungal-type domain-containing protein n=1 Tax=Penicillium salamii TaxID=1612424 RepID=A0A9W4K1V4_9EURO|nr:unnamed protein product [Penicillium salamii]CAG7938710.1 unnamed protein product [Penicillium salamii]CAG7951309.1 unnamed protein product [Penicillium salamii]CAG8226109.1 unnamed protein product [Penicillium salamii]CAG8294722.1 unnamed protein product [Penicillium salamii]
MNRSCNACAESKLRCDLNKSDPPCSRCLQKGWVCMRAERKKRARKIKETSSLPSPQTGSDDGPYKVTDLAALDEQSVDLSFLDKYLSEEVDFLAQLADLENSVDMSRFTWTLQDMPSIISDDSLTQYSIDQPTCEMNVAQMTMNVGFLCPGNFRLPADYVLELEGPSTVAVDRLETYARLFFAHFHSFLPILHIPTFCLASSPSVLVRAVCFIGAGFENNAMSNSDAKLFHESLSSQLAKCCLHYDKAPPTLQELQALVLFQFASMANGGSAAERAASRLLHPLLVATIRQAGLLKIHGECSKATRSSYSWHSWIEKESKKRVLWGVFTVDCYQSVLCGSKPLLLPTDTRASFPCNDASWNACSASLWAAMPAQDPTSCFLSSLKGLMIREAPSESNLTNFGMNLLILAIHSLLIEAQTSILPVDLSALEGALHTWHTSWKQLQRNCQRHQSDLSVGNILIANSLSLYYLACRFLRNGRPVLDENAYLGKSRVTSNPHIIKEQAYQDEMMRCVRELLDEFQEEEISTTMIFK